MIVMNVVIRADASVQIGTGHVMRCLTLAEQLKERGTDVAFICREHEGHLCEFIRDKGFHVFALPGKDVKINEPRNTHEKWLGVPQERDAAETIEVLKTIRPDLLIVDHYGIDHIWEQTIRPYVHNIMVIDDLADRPHQCDYLLDQNFYEQMNRRYDALVPRHCSLFLGPKYALLRKEFRQTDTRVRNQLNHALVFFGGSDLSNETARALQAIQHIKSRTLTADVVLGKNNPYKDELKARYAEDERIHFHIHVDYMARLMNRADVCIGAGGSTTWERCYLGLPTIMMTVAKNQEEIARDLSENGIVHYLGKKEDVTPEMIAQSLEQLIQHPDQLRQYSQKSVKLMEKKEMHMENLFQTILQKGDHSH